MKFNSLLSLINHFKDEDTCINYIADIRWKDGIYCPHCESKRKIYKYKGNRLYKCADCKKQFTVRMGTIFESSKLPLIKWLMAFYLVTSHKKGISSVQLSKDIGVTQQTAWFLLQRIRHVVATALYSELMSGIVEIDETYVGGKESNKHQNKKTGKHNKIQGDKVPMLGILERKGRYTLQQFDKVNKQNIQPIIDKFVAPDAIVNTDSSPIYRGALGSRKRCVVNHRKDQYVDGLSTTNSVEGTFAHFKRMITGIYHHVSHKHIQKYADLFSFRWNTRKFTEKERLDDILSMINFKHLSYKDLIKLEI